MGTYVRACSCKFPSHSLLHRAGMPGMPLLSIMVTEHSLDTVLIVLTAHEIAMTQQRQEHSKPTMMVSW